jgi:hypothetical protein
MVRLSLAGGALGSGLNTPNRTDNLPSRARTGRGWGSVAEGRASTLACNPHPNPSSPGKGFTIWGYDIRHYAEQNKLAKSRNSEIVPRFEIGGNNGADFSLGTPVVQQ